MRAFTGHLTGCGGTDPHNSLTSASSASLEHFPHKTEKMPNISIESGSHWWEASALTTALPLLPTPPPNRSVRGQQKIVQMRQNCL